MRWKYQTKLFIRFGVVIIAVMILYFGISITYIGIQEREDYRINTDYETSAIADNFNVLLDSMDYLTTFMLSDSEVLNAIDYLSREENEVTEQKQRACMQTIRRALSTYYVDKYFNKVNFFNDNGIFVSSSNLWGYSLEKEQVKKILESNYDLDFKGYRFMPMYQDVWEQQKPEQVVGMIRRISGDNKGYFEIQMKYEDFIEIFERPFEYDVKLMAAYDGEVIYKNFSDDTLEAEMAEMGSENRDTSRGGMLLSFRDYAAGEGIFRIYYAIPLTALINQGIFVYAGTIFAALVVLVVSYLFMQSFIKRLVRPMKVLERQMDQTGIENLELISGKQDNQKILEEIKTLYQGYDNLILRIKEGKQREQKLKELQMRTNFDTLQAQINPHFINNILNVISYRGMALGDDEICDICSCISDMLKYSTNIKVRSVTILDELNYLNAYLKLIKYRYSEKFYYQVSVDEKLYTQEIPKVVIQQLVENCIQHGFHTPYARIEISVKGWIDKDWWYIEVRDNGDGFQEERRRELLKKKEEIRKKVLEEKKIEEMEIGGMGLVNTYSRMLLLYRGAVAFYIRNGQNGGGIVTIGGQRRYSE